MHILSLHSTIKQICKHRHFLDDDTAFTLCNSVICPYFTYCIEILRTMHKSNTVALYTEVKRIRIFT